MVRWRTAGSSQTRSLLTALSLQCTLWYIESLARAGVYEPEKLSNSVNLLEDFLGYTSYLGNSSLLPVSCFLFSLTPCSRRLERRGDLKGWIPASCSSHVLKRFG